MIFLNNELTPMEESKLARLKQVFPSFFEVGDKQKPVALRNNEGFSYKAKVGRAGGNMKVVDRPNAGVRITMRARYYDAEYKNNEIVVSSSPPQFDSKGNAKFGKKDGLSIAHGTVITDPDQLYFLYFFYPNISNGECAKKSPVPQFSFVMEELEQKNRLNKAAENARIVSAIASELSDVSVSDILRKLDVPSSNDALSNRDLLLSEYNTGRKSEVSSIVDSVLLVISEQGKTAKVDVQAVVEAAIENGKVKIEEGKLYILKKDGTFSTKADKSLSSAEEDEQLLEAVAYFSDNENKLNLIL